MQEVKGYICTMAAAAHKKMINTPSGRRTRSGILTRSLMILAILTITGFQGYWLKNNYDREKETLDIATKSSFKETVQMLQANKVKLERLDFQLDTIRVRASGKKPVRKAFNGKPARMITTTEKDGKKESVITVMNLLQESMDKRLNADSTLRKGFITIRRNGDHSFDSIRGEVRLIPGAMPSVQIPILDSITGGPENIKKINVDRNDKNGDVVSIIYSDKKHAKDSFSAIPEKLFVRSKVSNLKIHDTNEVLKDSVRPNEAMFRWLTKIDSLYTQDSVTIAEITTAYADRIKRDDINVPFTVARLDSTQSKSEDAVTFGFTNPVSFELNVGNTFGYMLNKLKLPILFSLLLVGLTIAAFLLLYRNMMKQKRLAEMKNDLISNISHELKTPIATVGVALEALKSFNAMHDPARTKEYIEISQSELQRLNLLVDKVLKLSIFEKKDIELKKERFDYRQLTSEIMNSMRLQFEKFHANVNLHTEGDSFYIDADKLHITSVVYNLLDNALKYGSENPVIDVNLVSDEEYIKLIVQDNGIGIPAEYKSKVFEKFFRVPTGDQHNIKGYGLGLSYVAEVVKRHEGTISVESEPGKGSTFTVTLPKAKTPVITLDPAVESKKQTS